MVDPSFHRTGVPASGQALDDGVPVLLQAGGERVESGRILGAACGGPVFEVLARACCEDLGECADVPLEGGKFWALGEDGGELPAFFVAQMVGVAHHPAGDLQDAG